MSLERKTRECIGRRLLRLALFLLASPLAFSSFAQDASYPIKAGQLSIPAGSYGATLTAQVADPAPALNFGVCFYTGYGSSSPLVPASYTSSGGSAAISYAVPTSTIQQVPPSAFSQGKFTAIVYTVPVSASACTGASQALGNSATVTLAFPSLSGLSISSAPQFNPKLTARLPANLTLTGTNFLAQTGAGTATPSAVTFSSDSVVPGAVRYISLTVLVSTIPIGIDPYVSHVFVQVCNTAVYSYCSNTERLNLDYLPTDDGTVTATPSTALPTQPVTVSATFGSATPSLAGAPGGLVAFHYASTVLGSSQLILDPTAILVPAPATGLQTKTSLASPLAADFNQDGIPDLLTFEPGTPNLHLVFGGPGSGGFATDQAISLPVPDLALLSAAVGDFNHDGFPDIALLGHVTGAASNTLYTLLNDGSGSFGAPSALSTPVYASNILAADFNRDGLSDIVLAGAVDAQGDTGLQVLFGDGKGNFSAGPVTSGLNTAPSAGFGGFQIAAADLNGDGFPDIAVLNGANASGSEVSKSIGLFQNDGKGNFVSTGSLATDGTASASFEIAPLAPGQNPAVVITSSTGISIALNQSGAAIAFAATLPFTAIANLKQAAVGDFNGDGLLDAVVDDGSTIHVLNGDGKGSFAAAYSGLSIPSTAGTTILAYDANLDTYADLITLSGAGANSFSLRSWITAGTATATLPPATYPVGVHSIQARTLGTFYLECGSVNGTLTINPIVSPISVAASVAATVNFGSPVTLGATISDPTATGKVSFYNGKTLLGTATLAEATVSNAAAATASFTSAALPAGAYSVTAVYAGDATHAGATSAAVQFQILPVAPTLTWGTPAGVIAGAQLTAAQLDATATGVTGKPLPGTFTYTPALGAVLTAGTQTLTAVFTPADVNDYTTASASVSIQVTLFAISGLSSDLAILGDPAKTITLTGTGFLPGAGVLMSGVPVATTFVNSTTLTAVIPASNFLVVHTIQVAVTEPIGNSQTVTTPPVPLYVGAPLASVVFSGPSSIVPGSQITLDFQLTNPYPVPLSATFTLGFTPAAGLPSDPNVVFASGGNTWTVVIPAASTESPQVVIQTGTVAGTLVVGLDLVAGGTDVTPASIKPLNLQAPLAVPGITSVTATGSGNTLTVTTRGFSNTRQILAAKFHFTPVPGASIGTEDVTIDVGSLFTTWYADPASDQYGSAFTYSQTFTLSSDAGVVGQVTVTLSNSVGASTGANTP